MKVLFILIMILVSGIHANEDYDDVLGGPISRPIRTLETIKEKVRKTNELADYAISFYKKDCLSLFPKERGKDFVIRSTLLSVVTGTEVSMQTLEQTLASQINGIRLGCPLDENSLDEKVIIIQGKSLELYNYTEATYNIPILSMLSAVDKEEFVIRTTYLSGYLGVNPNMNIFKTAFRMMVPNADFNSPLIDGLHMNPGHIEGIIIGNGRCKSSKEVYNILDVEFKEPEPVREIEPVKKVAPVRTVEPTVRERMSTVLREVNEEWDYHVHQMELQIADLGIEGTVHASRMRLEAKSLRNIDIDVTILYWSTNL